MGSRVAHAFLATGSRCQHMTISIPHLVGQYTITPLASPTDCGNYAAAVSVRRGKHDRVFRLVPVFSSATEATCYALAQGKRLVLQNQLG